MIKTCPQPIEIAAQLALPESDPGRAHLDRCPRCQALAASFREFLEPTGTPSAADRQDADQRLRAALVREGGPPPLPSVTAGVPGGAVPAGAPERSRHPGRPSRRRPRGRVLPTRWRWAAVGAAAAAVVALALVRPGEPRMGPTVLREQPGRTTAAPAPLLAAPRVLDGQGVELSWTPVVQADAYEVVLYSVNLVEVARLGPQTQSELLLSRAQVPPAIVAGTPLLVRVVALRQGAPLSTSRAASLLTPP